MSYRPALVSALVVVGAFVMSGTREGTAPTKVLAAGTPAQSTSTLDDQTELSLTVYNSEIALVRDVRQVQLPTGAFDLDFQDIAATINPATVHFRSLTDPQRVSVLEQNYEYDLLEPDKLLRKYIGRDVTLVRMRQVDGATREVEVKARLLSFNSAPVWQIDGEIVTGLGADHIRFPELPDNLHSRPTLIWALANEGPARHRVEVSYLAGQLTWNSDYVLTVARDDKTADLDGWVTLSNKSGTAFKNATLQLVAGDLNRVRQAMGRGGMDMAVNERTLAAAPQMAEETLGDYHLYSVGRKTTINNAETKQVSMLTGTGLPLSKRYVVNGQSQYYRTPRTYGVPTTDPVQVFYQFKNEERAGLGLPMPAGVIRVYQADSRGGLQFMGEDRISHTPKDETIKIKTGHAFDIVSERRQMDYQRISDRIFETAYEITIRNHKTNAATIELNEPFGGDWRLIESSHAWTKADAWTARYTVTVPADGQAVLKYRVRVTY